MKYRWASRTSHRDSLRCTPGIIKMRSMGHAIFNGGSLLVFRCDEGDDHFAVKNMGVLIKEVGDIDLLQNCKILTPRKLNVWIQVIAKTRRS